MRTLMLLAVATAAAWWAEDARADQVRDAEMRSERRVVAIHPDRRLNDMDADVYADREQGDDRPRRRWYREEAPVVDARGWDDDDMARRCGRRDNGVGGAVIGGVVGGVVGNRVAGRGNRTAGTILGAGAGAIAGAVIDRAEDRDQRADCDAWWAERGRAYYGDYAAHNSYDLVPGGAYAGDAAYAGGTYAYQGGYGGMQTIIIPGAPIIIEETETFYETVTIPGPRVRARVAHRPRARRAARPAAPRCTCTCTIVCRR